MDNHETPANGASRAADPQLPPPERRQEFEPGRDSRIAALTGAVQTARASLARIGAMNLAEHPARRTPAHANLAAPEALGLAAHQRSANTEANPMTSNDKRAAGAGADDMTATQTTPQAQSSGNGNGTAQAGAPSGSVFTEPTPGGKEKTVAQLFGEIVWLFSQSPKHKNFFVSDLEWLVMTPVLLRQFRVFYAPDRPIGVALWGFVTGEVEERLKSGHARLAPADWKSGETLWLVDIVAPFGGHDAMLKDLKEKVFPEREVKFAAVKEGKLVVASL